MPSSLPLSLSVETKTQSPSGGQLWAASPSSRHASRGRLAARLASRLVLRSASRSVLLACLIRPCGPRRLIRSPLPRRLAFFSSAHRPAPCLVSPSSPPHRQAGRGGTIGWRSSTGGRRLLACLGWRRADGGVCLLASDGNGRRAVIDGGWLRAAGVGVASCLPRVDGRSGSIVPRSFLDRSSFPLIVSSNRRGPGSFHHLIVPSTGMDFLFLFARPPPACSSRLACLGLFPRPRPGDAWAAAWLAAAGGTAACLRSRVPCRSLAAARSLVAICLVSLVPLVPSWGVVGRFMGFSDRYLVGVGVSQNMPLNRILWLLAGIFGYVVRCPFSALPVASFSPICPARRPLPAAVSRRWLRACLCCELEKTARVRSFVFWIVFRFSCHVMDDAGGGLPCRGDGVGGVVVLAFIGSRIPCPLGRGNMCGLRVSVPPAVRGLGCS